MKGTKMSSAGVFWRVADEAKPYRFHLLVGGVLALFASLLDASLALALKYTIDGGFEQNFFEVLRFMPWLILIFFLVRGVLNFSSRYMITYAGRSVILSMRSKLFSHVLRLPRIFFNKNNTSSILSCILYNIEQVANASTTVLLNALRDGTLIIGLLLSMLFISWKLFIITCVCGPITYFAIQLGGTRSRHYSRRLQDSVAHVTQHANEVLNRIDVVKMHQSETFESERLDERLVANRHHELRVNMISGLTSSCVQLLAASPAVIIAYVIGHQYIEVSLGSFVAFVAILLQFLRPLRSLTELNAEVQKGIAGAEGVFSYFDIIKEPHIDMTHKTIGNIDLKAVCFSYNDTKNTGLNNISINMKKGEKIAIIGPSGSGKSTLLKLLCGYYLEETRGDISFDGIPMTKDNCNYFRQNITMASQSSDVISGSVADNVAYAQDVFDLGRIKEVLKVVQLYDDVHNLGGVDLRLGKGFRDLSGGQYQRLSLARALYKSADVLLLDEVTSSLDVVNEKALWDAVMRFSKKRLMVCVTHSIDYVDLFDRVIFIVDGEIQAEGPHELLLQNHLDYRQFCEGLGD
ncbi:MAG TPA: ABC transporter transmembrane domain-containing protein [Gammaproteobacteria bacterium]|nr:ABC transporter transmembrane domain-containing protein [Gammaproteobacteria bacterium]